ncbi:glycosyltransferase family 4 protein [Eisenbergiella sp. OF01-20]|uniref:glycosyltransferase family 4 protein n=2 Tax=unclassified Eisenbergiella TaxID=2652273 RepID=UPI001FA9DBAF|nr:glycosyltransferase [Eisenbergiella sp. OF01-20]
MQEKVLLFFGFVREYKGLRYLIEAMPEISRNIADIKLMIVGDFGSEENKEAYVNLIKENEAEEFIDIYDGYIPDREIEKFFAACDLVVLPYVDATQSGIVQIAYGFEKPVVVTDVGGLPDVVEDGKTGYVVEARNQGELAEAVITYFQEQKETDFEKNVRDEAYRFSWERMTEIIERLSR